MILLSSVNYAFDWLRHCIDVTHSCTVSKLAFFIELTQLHLILFLLTWSNFLLLSILWTMGIRPSGRSLSTNNINNRMTWASWSYLNLQNTSGFQRYFWDTMRSHKRRVLFLFFWHQKDSSYWLLYNRTCGVVRLTQKVCRVFPNLLDKAWYHSASASAHVMMSVCCCCPWSPGKKYKLTVAFN